MADVNNAAEGVGDDQTLQETPEQTFDRLQEALRREIREAVQEATRALEAKVEERLARVERRVKKMALEAANLASEGMSGEKEDIVKTLEGRMHQLEVLLQKTLEGVIPRVDPLLKQLEGKCPPAPLVVPSTSSDSPQLCALPSVSSAALTSSVSPSPLVPSPAVPSSTPSTASVPSPLFNIVAKSDALGKDLYKIAAEGRVTDVQRLLNEGAHVDQCDPGFDRTPLMWAASYGHADVVLLLLERGANVNAAGGFFRGTALHSAAANDHSGRSVELLVDGGAQVHCQDTWGRTALHSAASMDNERAVRVLIAAGASDTVNDKDGWFPSDLAKDPLIREIILSSSHQPSP